MIPNKGNSILDNLIERNQSLLCSVPKCFLKQKIRQPHKNHKQKLSVQHDIKWLNDYLNFHKKKSKNKYEVQSSPKAKKHQKKRPTTRPLSNKRKNNLIIHESNKNNIENNTLVGNVVDRKQIYQCVDSSRFGILSDKSIVKALDCNQIIQHQKKVKKYQNHVRRLSCQLKNNYNSSCKNEQSQNLYGDYSEEMSKQISQRFKMMQKKANKAKKIIHSSKNRRLSQNINPTYIKKIQSETDAYLHKKILEPQPWIKKNFDLKQQKQEDNEFQNYVHSLELPKN